MHCLSILVDFFLQQKGYQSSVSDPQLGHDVFSQIIKKCSEGGREIIGYCILKGEITEGALLEIESTP